MNNSMSKLSISITVLGVMAIALNACKSKGSATSTSASTAQTTTVDTSVKQTSTNISELDDFLASFEKATLSHNSSEILRHLDKDYKKEQYEKLLKNNTDSFLNKFYSDNQTKGDGFKIPFKKITKITRLGTTLMSGYFTVNYKVEAGSDAVTLTLAIITKLDKGVVRYALYGPVG